MRSNKIISLMLILISLILVGCNLQSKENNVKSNNSRNVLEDKNTIYWLVGDSDSCGGNDNYEDISNTFNKELKKDGYNFNLKIVELGNPWETYRQGVEDYIKSGKPADIITNLFWDSEEIVENKWRYVDEDNLLPFDKLDKSLVDMLLNKGTKVEWNSVKYNDKIYYIPNDEVYRTMKYNFNNKKISNSENSINNETIKEASKTDGFIFEGIMELKDIGYRTGLISITSDVFVDGETASVGSLYNQKAFIEMLNLYNDLYKNGYINGAKDIDVSLLSGEDLQILGCIPEGTELSLLPTNFNNSMLLFDILNKYNLYSISSTFIPNKNKEYIEVPRYVSSNLRGTGISSKSKKPDNAFKLLFLVNTERKYSDILLHGVEGKDYIKDKGIISDNKKISSMRESNFNPFYNRSPIEKSDIWYTNDEENLEINSKALPSPYLGFNFNPDGYEDIIKSVTDIAIKNLDIWKSDNLEAELERVRKELSDVGVDKLTAEVKRQVEEWKKIVE